MTRALHLIASDGALLQALQARLQQAGVSVIAAVERLPGQALAPMLHRRDAEVLVLDLPAASRSTDLADLQAAHRQWPGLQVLALSDDTSAEAWRAAARAGVRELLPLPARGNGVLQADELLQALAALQPFSSGAASTAGRGAAGAAAQPTRPLGAVVAVIGARGGSGASFLASQLAWVAAESLGRDTVLVDLDLQCADASFYAGDGAWSHSLADVAQAFERLDAALLGSLLHHLAPRLQLLAAPADPEQALLLQPAHLARTLALLQAQHELVLLDVPRHLDALALQALDRADTVCLVTEPLMHCLRDARRLLQVLRAVGLPDARLQLVINRQRSGTAVSDDEVQNLLGLPIVQRLPAQPALVDEAIGLGRPLLRLQPQAPLTQAIMALAAQLLHQPLPAPRSWLARWFDRPGAAWRAEGSAFSEDKFSVQR